MGILPLLFSCRSQKFYGSIPQNIPGFKEEKVIVFPEILHETSGLEYFKNRFWTFNDSGGEALLYAFKPGKENLIPEYFFTTTRNTDWEDICADDSCFYIGDTGNNYGWRDTLEIYKFNIEEFLKGKRNYETIRFSFSEKTEEIPVYRKNPFDCEAMVVKDDNLLIFTKNREDKSTWMYKLPVYPGYYNLSLEYRIEAGMLVTGADYYEPQQILWLIGYRNMTPVIQAYSMEKKIPELITEIVFRHLKGMQVEGICCDDQGNIWFSNEKSRGRQALWLLKEMK